VARTYKRRRAAWSADEIVAKLREWHELYGDIPSAADWNASDTRRAAGHHSRLARRWLARLRRFEDGEWPWTGSVHKRFGSWNAAIRAAGFEPRAATRPPRDPVERGTGQQLAKLADRAARAEGEDRRRLLLEVAERALALADDL
jgi:hypothetical protein